MRVLILVGRFHPNLTEWVEAFRLAGDDVTVITGGDSVNRVERVKPRIVPENAVSQSEAEAIAREIRPDLVIIRSKEDSYRRIVKAAKGLGAKAIYYDQRAYLRKKGFKPFHRELRKAFRRFRQGHPRVGITTTLGKGEVPRLWRHWIHVPMPVPDDIERRPYFKDGLPTVLMVGRLANEKKRHLWVLQALEESGHPYRLLVAGAGDDSHTTRPGKRSQDYYQKVKETLAAAGHRGSVELQEDLPHEQMAELYLQADIFVLPSTKELLGISVVEAMARGCAVIASNGVGACGYISHGKDGLIFPRASYEAFRDTLHTLLSDKDYTRALGQNAAKTIKNRHGHGDFVNQIRQIARV
ncbi:glycosyltransferase involved in cell wall biosynthesis [Natronocella acetinitrilica]|uniref:Glycosyltransferase involved in cell wall biosynthesis n=1 Tax=Natronocella acetinitrilica TaxID=414046 RepID=A0AAE3G2S2_9GAMM|nr:glycosyltransferase family 4 protein [Natronocella acetinitrilica]MCP1673964.1 glycosyltransferase involved in cell wall biosynthesis [Natronocella acetinitrilica]